MYTVVSQGGRGGTGTGEDLAPLSPLGRGAGGEGLPANGDNLQQLQESALLSIKVCDPACGSGHFLLAAARRIGKELAKVRTGEAAPSPEPLREATRDVIQYCIYGVDINPLAVDLCKVALWIEGFAKGMPLNFLDHRIKCGNSLVGVLNLDVLKEGIPDEAFKAVTGDDKALSSIKKKANKQERLKDLKGQLSTAGQLDDDLAEIASAWQELDRIPENTPEFVKQKKERYEANQRDRKWWRSRSACNLWTAAFFMPLTEQNLQLLPTTAALVRLLNEDLNSPSDSGIGVRDIVDAANQLASVKGFFHWALEFPDVFENDGFDCILGNPPWETVQLEEKEFFLSRKPEIAALSGSARKQAIKELEIYDSCLSQDLAIAKHYADAQSKFLRESGRCSLTATGKINTYSVFTETAYKITSSFGYAGLIIPSAIATSETTKNFFDFIVSSGRLSSLFDFAEIRDYFVGVGSPDPFCLFTIRSSANSSLPSNFIFKIFKILDIQNPTRKVSLLSNDFQLLNPNTKTCPVFRTSIDANLSKKIYTKLPIIENEKENSNPWQIKLKQGLFNMTSDSSLFFNSPRDGDIPLYEAKMMHNFDHRFGSYETRGEERGFATLPQTNLTSYQDINYKVQPFYWVSRLEVEKHIDKNYSRKWFVVFRGVTKSLNERTAICAVIPMSGIGNSLSIVFFNSKNPQIICCFVSNFNSIVFDYVARQKFSGVNLNSFIVKQLPVLPPDRYSQNDINYITPRVLELTYTAWDIKPFADDLWNPTPTRSQSEVEGSNAETDSILTQASDKKQLKFALDIEITGKKQLELITPPDPTHQTHLRQLILEQWQANRAAFEQDPHPPAPSPKEGEGEQDSLRTPLPTWERGRGEGLTDNLEGIPLPPFIWHETRRAQIRAELDAYYAKLYGLTRDELRYILDPADIYGKDFPSETFRVLKNNEMKKYGEYRTHRLVLQAWDNLGY